MKTANSTITAFGNASPYQAIQNFREFYSFFEKTTFWGQITDLEDLTPAIQLINCKRFNPIYQTILLDEDIYLVDLRTSELTIDFPLPFVEELVKENAERKLYFLSPMQGIVLKTTMNFLLYLSMHSQRPDSITRTQFRRLVDKIAPFVKKYSIPFTLLFQCENSSLFPPFFRDVDRTFAEKILRDEMIEYWRFLPQIPFWEKKYMKAGYVGLQILALQQTYKKRRVYQKAQQSLNPTQPIFQKISVTPDLTSDKGTTEIVNPTININLDLNSFVTLNGQLNAILDYPLQAMDNADLMFNEIQRKITTAATQIMPDQPAIVFDLDQIANKVPAIKQFLQFQSETDKLQITVIESIKGAYICRFSDENEKGPLLLFDIRGGDESNQIYLSDQALVMLFDELSPKFRLFFIDSESTYIMEVLPNFLNQYIFRLFDPEDLALQSEMTDLNHEVIELNQTDKTPLCASLRVHCPQIEILINDMDKVDMDEDICERVVSIWRSNTKTRKYEQVYPPPEEDENGKNEGDIKPKNSSEQPVKK